MRRFFLLSLSLVFLFCLLSFGLARLSTPREYLPEGTGQTFSFPLTQETGQFPVDLNTATADDLTLLPGIGPVRAQAILDYRSVNGFFLTTEEIVNVYGIGEGIYRNIADLITVSSPNEAELQ